PSRSESRTEPRTESRSENGRADVGERDNRRDHRDTRPERGEPRNERDTEDEGDGAGRRSRRSRFRDRRRGRGEGGGTERGERTERSGGEPSVTEDDVLVPVAGIVDVLDNYAFVRTSGYLSGPNDVYVSMSQVKKHGLRRGDAVTGAVRAAPRDGGGSGDQRRDKYNPLVRLDTINGMEPEEA